MNNNNNYNRRDFLKHTGILGIDIASTRIIGYSSDKE